MADSDESAQVERHVAHCGSCAADLVFMRQTALALHDSPLVEPPAQLRQAILDATIYRPTWRQRLAAAWAATFAEMRAPTMALVGAAGATLAAVLLFAHTRPPVSTYSE